MPWPANKSSPWKLFSDGINDILERGFTTEEIHAHLQKTLIEPDSLQRYIFFRPERYTRNLSLQE